MKSLIKERMEDNIKKISWKMEQEDKEMEK